MWSEKVPINMGPKIVYKRVTDGNVRRRPCTETAPANFGIARN
jgi:hypothetical protein